MFSARWRNMGTATRPRPSSWVMRWAVTVSSWAGISRTTERGNVMTMLCCGPSKTSSYGR